MNLIKFFRLCCALLCLFPAAGWTANGETSTTLLQAPKVQLQDIKLTSLGFRGAEFAIFLVVNNPNNLPVVVENILYDLSLVQKPIKNGVIYQVERFEAQSIREVRVPVSVSYAENLSAVLAALGRDASSEYEIQGSVKLRGFDERFAFAHRGQW